MTKWKRHHVNIQVGFYTKCFFAELLGPSSNKALFIRLLKASDLKKNYQGFTTQVLKVCRALGPIACSKLLQKVCLKRWRKEKKFHDWTWAASNLQPSDLM